MTIDTWMGVMDGKWELVICCSEGRKLMSSLCTL